MTRFRDVYAPAEMPGYPCVSSPRTSTTIVLVSSGAEHGWSFYDLMEVVNGPLPVSDVVPAISRRERMVGG